MNGTMNATELHELVKGWPREAWPNIAYRGRLADDESFCERWCLTNGGICPGRDVALLFEASGMRWLATKLAADCNVTACKMSRGWKVFRDDISHEKAGDLAAHPSLLHALSAAILATKGAADGK